MHVLQVVGRRFYEKWTLLQVFLKYFAKNLSYHPLYFSNLETATSKEHLSVADSV